MKIATFYRSTPEIDALELKLIEQLRLLDQEYKRQAQPILDQIANLHAMKIPVVTILPDD